MDDPSRLLLILVAVGAAAAYFAGRASLAAVARMSRTSAGTAGVVAMMPVLLAAVVLAFVGHSDAALGLATASAVVALSLVAGVALMATHPEDSDGVAAEPSSAAWPAAVAPVLVLLAAGYSDDLQLLHAGALAVLGVVAAVLWRGTTSAQRAAVGVGAVDGAGRGGTGLAAVAALLAVVAAGVVAGVVGVAESSVRVPDAGARVAAIVLAPVFLLPLIGHSARQASRRQAMAGVGSGVSAAVVALCVVVPLVGLAAVAGRWWFGAAGADAGPVVPMVGRWLSRPLLPFPHRVWRSDAVVLAVLAISLVPVAWGKVRPRALEGVALMLVYAAFVLVSSGLVGAR